MATYEYDICVGKKNEKTDKTYWTKIGGVFKTDKGMSIKLEQVPVGWDGWASLFVPKPKQDAKPNTNTAAADGFPDEAGEIPF